MWAFVFLTALVAPSLAQQCDPGTCKLPDCRCWDDKTPPGGLDISEIPQIVMVTMENSITPGVIDNYENFFNVQNPNGCPVRGTFFVEDTFTDYNLVQTLYNDGHEIGVNSLNGANPADLEAWNQMYKTMKNNLKEVGIDEKEVLGARGAGFTIGGDDEFIALGDNGLRYDSSCARVSWSSEGSYVWPFTVDFKMPPCDIGQEPSLAFPGYWEFPIADLREPGTAGLPCLAPSACRNVSTKADAFDLFFTAFEGHYKQGRIPFMLVIDTTWAATKEFREGTIEFLDYIRATFPDDVWIVPAGKALQWIQDPVPLSNITSFAPWGCN